MPNIKNVFENKKIYTWGELFRQGIEVDDIRHALRAGEIIHPIQIESEGPIVNIIAAAEAEFHPDFDDCVTCLATGGIICLQSAAMRQNLATSIRTSVDIFLPHAVTRVASSLNVTIHRSRRQETFEVGIISKQTELGVEIDMTSPARTVVDLIRNRKNSEEDYRQGLQAIHTYVEDGGDLEEINDIAAQFGGRTADLVDIAVSTAYEGMTRRMGA